jgi:hypothetical protein
MNKKISWETMKTQYPDEWLLIVDYELNKSGHLEKGIVEKHSRNKDDIYKLPQINKPAAFRFTGESNFAGLRSHANN